MDDLPMTLTAWLVLGEAMLQVPGGMTYNLLLPLLAIIQLFTILGDSRTLTLSNFIVHGW